MPKIICLSDTHTYENFEVPEGDILIHSGDISFRGTFAEMNKGMRWLGKFPHPFKIFVAGNHDFLPQEDHSLMKALAEENGIVYLENEQTTVMGLKIYGSPMTPTFGQWAFMKDRGIQIAYYWKQLPDDTEILITHGSPYGILDEVNRGIINGVEGGREHVGCEELRKRVNELKDLKLHVFGHLHDNNGIEDIKGVKFVNAAICNESYEPIQPVRIVEL